MKPQSLTTLRSILPILLGIFLFGFGVYALNHLMHSVDPALVMTQVRSTAPLSLALAVGATAIGYAALVGYDALALRFIGKSLPRPIVALGGFLGYAFGNTIGVSMISGGAVRYRIYSSITCCERICGFSCPTSVCKRLNSFNAEKARTTPATELRSVMAMALRPSSVARLTSSSGCDAPVKKVKLEVTHSSA
jgi:hypothetical protein